MNLYGNSLKYCEQGFINVTLKSEPIDSKRSMVILNVTDSGKGMSEEYLRNHLFKPFAQENPLAPGTGLGLSIIRQIIVLLGGEIVVRSQKDVGTDILVKIPMVHSKEPFGSVGAPILDEVLRVRESTIGLGICVLDIPEDLKTEEQLETGVDSGLWDHKSNHMRSALETLCANWFGMNVNAQKKDIYLIGENSHNFADLKSGWLLDQLQDEAKETTGDDVLQVIILCKTAFSASNLQRTVKRQGSRAVVFISQPCGPRKLAKALTLVLERRADIMSGRPDEDGSQIATETNKQRDPISIRNDYETAQPIEPIKSTALQFDHDQASTPLPVILEAQSLLEQPAKTETPEDVEQKPAKSSQASIPPSAHTSEPFLLVDDNPINLQVLSMYCKKNKFTYATARDGLEAYDTYRNAKLPFKTVFMGMSNFLFGSLTRVS